MSQRRRDARSNTCDNEINPAARKICATGKIQILLKTGLVKRIRHRCTPIVPRQTISLERLPYAPASVGAVWQHPKASDRWHEQIGDPTLADGILDRLVHNAHHMRCVAILCERIGGAERDNLTSRIGNLFAPGEV